MHENAHLREVIDRKKCSMINKITVYKLKDKGRFQMRRIRKWQVICIVFMKLLQS